MTRGPQPKPIGQKSVIFLAAIAMMITQTFRFTSHWSGWVVLSETALTLLTVFALSRTFRRRQINLADSIKPHFICHLTMTLLPIAVQVITRSLGIGDPNELVLLNIVQNISLALAVIPASHKSLQISALLNGFLVLFVTAMTDNSLIWTASVIYAAFGLWWMMCSYWERLETKFAAATNRTIPLRPVLIALTLLTGLGAITVASIGVPKTAMVLAGFMPTSGGDKYPDPNARSGVGEGDMMIAAEDSAFSFGPVDSEILLESKMPSLYDVASDQYGEARVKKQINKEMNQAISLTSDRLRHNHQKTASSKQAARQFSALRRLSNQRRASPDERNSTALFHVAGNTPLHLITQRFDFFDGVEWTHSGRQSTPLNTSITSVDGKPWLTIYRNSGEVLRGKQSHTLRIINLKSKQIPSPPHLTGIHIADVNRESFYAMGADRVFELAAQEFIPQLTVIHLLSQVHSERALVELGDFRGLYSKMAQKQQDPIDSEKPPNSLASEWTQRVLPGWEQVMAITNNLRDQFKHDPMATAPEDCQNIVDHFLATGRGPDYMFASTAAVMLRSLGYETQVVMGFYADSEDYDSKAMQTIVDSKNLHFWTEVHVGQNIWVPVEPTPGFQPPKSWLTWQERISLAGLTMLRWTADNWHLITFSILGIVIAFRLRHILFDISSLLLWRIGWFGSTRRRIIWTVRILEVRALMAGKERPPSLTLSQWYRELAGTEARLQRNREPLEQVLALADLAFYSPTPIEIGPSSTIKTGVYPTCSKLLKTWTSRRMKRSTCDLPFNRRKGEEFNND